MVEIPPQGIADLAHLTADGVDLGLEGVGVHLGCHEVGAGNLKGSAATDWTLLETMCGQRQAGRRAAVGVGWAGEVELSRRCVG